MASGVSGYDSDEIDWNTDDDIEIFGTKEPSRESAPSSSLSILNGEAISSAGSSSSGLIHHFVSMGFSEDMVVKAIEKNGKGSDESTILETLLTYSVLEKSHDEVQGRKSSSEDSPALDGSPEQQMCTDYDLSSSDYDESFLDGLSDMDSLSDDEVEENLECSLDKEKKIRSLVKMGYSVGEVHTALERCGHEAPIAVLTDFLCAHQLASEQDLYLPEEVKPKGKQVFGERRNLKKRKFFAELYNRKKLRGVLDEEQIHFSHPMVGFGLPSGPRTTQRKLPDEALGPPFFYYENVAFTPKGVWRTISHHLFDVEPEFVDSKHFCAAARKRGYVHNLPIGDRFLVLPLPPLTIHDAFPLTKKWWPSWDSRTKLNCLLTAYASARLQERIRKAIEDYNEGPPLHVQKYVMYECRKWNLLWVGKNKVAPLEPDEVEMLLGFPRNHTRGGGTSRTDRYKSLGNSFQVDTVAYHLSALKPLFPHGINVLSLFSGIGGAEVALHRLGIPLKNVVSVEKSEVNRTILKCWWEEKNLSGNLIEFEDVRLLDSAKLEELIGKIGGFDLIIGGSPCNNLAGGNRVSRDGLEGTESILFFEYVRILKCVKNLMSQRQH